MGAQIDWSAAGGLDSVKQLTIQVGPREAARVLKLSPAHAESLKKMCSRGQWLEPFRTQRPTPPASISQVVKCTVPVVPKASDALAELLAEDSSATRKNISAGIRKASEHIATLEGDEVFLRSLEVKATTQTASLLHGWNDQASNSVRISIFTGQQTDEGPVIDV